MGLSLDGLLGGFIQSVTSSSASFDASPTAEADAGDSVGSNLISSYYSDSFEASNTAGGSSSATAMAASTSAAMNAINQTRLIGGRTGTCVATTRANLERAGLSGVPSSTGRDPNNARGMMVQMLQSGDWQSSAIPGSTVQTIRSPYGTVRASVLSGSAFQQAAARGEIPEGSVVFQTNHGWGYGGGAHGNDVGIVRNGAVFNYKQNRGMAIYRHVQQAVVLTPR